MDENTRWIASIHQEYTAEKAGRTSTGFLNGTVGTLDTLIVDLRVKACSAQEAISKAEKWLKESGIKNAHVKSVCQDGVAITDLTELIG